MKNPVVSRNEWLAARRALLEEEKEFTRMRDRLSKERRALPWTVIDKTYIFQSNDGDVSLSDLFDGRSQLIINHFMFHPQWDQPCKSCSFWADNYNGMIIHLNHRDVSMVAVSRAPLQKLNATRERMGWSFKWVSSGNNSLNQDFHVSFTEEELEKGEVEYNYTLTRFPSPEAPGMSVFFKDESGGIFHTYSCFARGLDILNGTYHYLDLVPKGRDEDALSYPMEWLRLKDQY